MITSGSTTTPSATGAASGCTIFSPIGATYIPRVSTVIQKFYSPSATGSGSGNTTFITSSVSFVQHFTPLLPIDTKNIKKNEGKKENAILVLSEKLL